MMDLFLTTPKDGYWLTESSIRNVEGLRDATYMGFWCTRTPSENGWYDTPVDVFYQPNPDVHAGHSHYFGLFYKNDKLYICDAKSAFSEPITGVITDDGEVIVSRYRHDYVTKGDHMIDGGREYVRCSLSPMAKITVDGSNFILERTSFILERT